MYRPLPDNAFHVDNIRVSAWTLVPDTDDCAMRYIEGTDPNVVANRVAFIEKTPRVRFQPFTNHCDDYRNWHQGWKGDDGFCEVARGWCDAQLQMMGYIVPDALPYNDDML